jgi:hypothetical protein
MKTILLLAAVNVSLGWMTAVMGAGEADLVQVQSSQAFCLGMVRNMDGKIPWSALQTAFVESLSRSLAGPDGKPMPVRPIESDGSKAAGMLLKGEYDAVLVMGEQLPSSLKGNKFLVTKAVSKTSNPVYVFQFVTRAGDSVAQSITVPAFEAAAAADGFQNALMRASAVRAVVTEN